MANYLTVLIWMNLPRWKWLESFFNNFRSTKEKPAESFWNDSESRGKIIQVGADGFENVWKKILSAACNDDPQIIMMIMHSTF